MKVFLRHIFLVGLIFFSVIVFGQNKTTFEIDTSRILTNENLDSFLELLRSDTFDISIDTKNIPRQVKKQLNNLTKRFTIANPDKPYQCCCTSPRRLPERQLLFLAKSQNVLVMTYKTGGIGVSFHILLIKFDKTNIVDLWAGYGSPSFKNVNEIVQYIDYSRLNNIRLNTNILVL